MTKEVSRLSRNVLILTTVDMCLWLNMELEFIWAPGALLYSVAKTPQPAPPPPPAFGLIYKGAIGQPR